VHSARVPISQTLRSLAEISILPYSIERPTGGRSNFDTGTNSLHAEQTERQKWGVGVGLVVLFGGWIQKPEPLCVITTCSVFSEPIDRS